MADRILSPSRQSASVSLGAEQELRVFDVHEGAATPLTITLTEGSAEICGVELALGQPHTPELPVPPVFSWYGCSVTLNGSSGSWYVAGDTPMPQYVAAHAQLERKRDEAAQSQGQVQGPRVMVVGPRAAGKTTLCGLLVRYATRLGRAPLLVDLDCGADATLGVPGCVGVSSAAPSTNGSNASELVHYFGAEDPARNQPFFEHQVGQLAAAVEERLRNNAHEAASGLVIDTGGAWELPLLLTCISLLRVDQVLVLGQDHLFAQVQRELGGRGVEVARLDRSGGVCEPSPAALARARRARVARYFYGPDGDLSPAQTIKSLNELRVVRVAQTQMDLSLLPIGAEAKHSAFGLEEVAAVPELAVLAVVGAGDAIDGVLDGNALGFVHVVAVGENADGVQELTLLCPCPGDLPSTTLVLGELQWTGES